MKLLGCAWFAAPALCASGLVRADPAPPPTPRQPTTIHDDPSAGPPPDEPRAPPLAPMTPLPVAAGPSQTPANPFAAHRGITFEAALGAGVAYISDTGLAGLSINRGMAATSRLSLAGMLAIGGFTTPRLALTLRAADIALGSIDSRISDAVIAAVIGPALQYWLTPEWWVGGGGGAAVFAFAGLSCGPLARCLTGGWGLDARLGYTFIDSDRLTVNVAAEVTPAFYSGWNATGFAVVFGYQYL